MWRCPECGRSFANPNQTHTCAALKTLESHFVDRDPRVRATYDAIVEALKSIGPVTVLPEKTRIALQVRMSFAALIPRKRWLDGHLVLARRIGSPRFRRIETFSPRNILHGFRLESPDEVDPEFISWLEEAYRVGEQRHLQTRPTKD